MGITEALDGLQDEYRDLVRRQQEVRASTGCQPGPVCVLVSMETDSICAARMIISLLATDDIHCTMTPVRTRGELIKEAQNAIKENENVINLILLNCGGSLPLSEVLSLESHIRVYLLDSHRPYHLANIPSEQIRILHDCLDNKKLEDYPQAVPDEEMDAEEEEMEELEEMRRLDEEEDAALEGEEEDEEEEGDRRADGSEGADADGQPSAKRRRRDQRQRERREREAARQEQRRQRQEGTFAERRRREQLRMRAVEQYYSGTSYGCSSAVVVYELSSMLKKSDNDSLWMAILGLTDQFIHERVPAGHYSAVQSHMSTQALQWNETASQARESASQRQTLTGNRAVDAVVTRVGHVGDLVDFRFPLLRQWSLLEAMAHSPYVAARLKTWTQKGREVLQTLLTEIGIPTRDASQEWKVLTPVQKMRVEELLEERGRDDRYKIPDVRFKSFQRQVSPTLALSASDMVLALSALMEIPFHITLPASSRFSSARSASSSFKLSPPSPSAAASSASAAGWSAGFMSVWKVLSSPPSASVPLLLHGLDQAKHACGAMLRAMDSIQLLKLLKPGGDFRYLTLPAGSPDAQLFARPLHLTRLALFLSEVSHEQTGAQRPIVICAPRGLDPAQALELQLDTHLVLAVLGTTLTPETPVRNPFGARFHAAAAPELPEREEGEEEEMSDDERRQWFVEQGEAELQLLAVKQEAFEHAQVEVRSEDVETFLKRIVMDE